MNSKSRSKIKEKGRGRYGERKERVGKGKEGKWKEKRGRQKKEGN